jgi:hypothetical protein
MSNISDNWKCIISKELMIDPVTTPDGITFDRVNILEWLDRSLTCPVTRRPLRSDQLIPNIALRNTIQEYLAGLNSQSSGESIVGFVAPPLQSREPIIVNLDVKTTKYNNNILAHVKVVPPSEGPRCPVGISVALDVSGSMGEEAAIQNDQIEILGYSRLDAAKHSLNAVVASLGDHDVFSLTTFTTEARRVFNPTKMNSVGKRLAFDCIKSLKPLESTNLYAGLENALEATQDSNFNGTNKHVLILTDGISNSDPPRGIMYEYDRFITRTGSNVNVHTFGYGYNLDISVLLDITKKSNGTYGYIPDLTMVGTVFINFLSYVLATFSCNNKLNIVPMNGTIIEHNYGYSSNELNIGNIQYGQSLDFVVKIKPGAQAPYLNITLTTSEGLSLRRQIEKQLSNITLERNDDILFELARLKLVETLVPNQFSIDSNYGFIQSLYSDVEELGLGDRIIPLLTDLKSSDPNEGQISKAFYKRDWNEKWGKYYIPAIRRANQLQYCNNFKDKSVQRYGGRMFNDLQDSSNDLFRTLQAPPPSITQRYSAPRTSNIQQGNLNTLGTQQSQSIGCFSGECQIDTPCGKWFVKEIRANDVVLTPTGPARVKCVIKTKIRGGLYNLVNINGLLITEWHPIRIEGKWYFPKEYPLGKFDEYRCLYVYDFVLDTNHIVIINGVECVTLGHNFQEDIVKHAYFGSRAVIRDLKEMPGWNEGLINIENSHFTYDKETSLINGWVFDN